MLDIMAMDYNVNITIIIEVTQLWKSFISMINVMSIRLNFEYITNFQYSLVY